MHFVAYPRKQLFKDVKLKMSDPALTTSITSSNADFPKRLHKFANLDFMTSANRTMREKV